MVKMCECCSWNICYCGRVLYIKIMDTRDEIRKQNYEDYRWGKLGYDELLTCDACGELVEELVTVWDDCYDGVLNVCEHCKYDYDII